MMDFRGKFTVIKRIWRYDNALQVIASRVCFRRTQSVIHRMGNDEFIIDYSLGEQNGTGGCVADRGYALFIEAMNFECGMQLRILDLGANGGGFALFLHQMGFHFTKLVAVEMNQRTFARLSFNLLRNLNGDIRLIQGAVSDRSGETTLAVSDGGISDSIYSLPKQQGLTRRVTLIALDELVNQHFANQEIDIIKIDIEGAEFEILGSHVKTSLKRARFILMEIHHHPDWSWNRVHEVMKKLGFELMECRSAFEPNVFLYQSKNNFN